MLGGGGAKFAFLVDEALDLGLTLLQLVQYSLSLSGDGPVIYIGWVFCGTYVFLGGIAGFDSQM